MFMYVSMCFVVIGAFVMMVISNTFARPIRNMAHIAKQMMELDFDAKIQVKSQDEIGELGNSMNEMSSKLEQTISDLKLANIKLEQDIEKKNQIDEMRKEFLSHVSHELKTPIALIQGYAEGLKDNINDDPESMEFYCDVILDEANKMNSLVMKLLDLNELEFGENNLTIERFELLEFLHDVINASSILLEQSGATLEFEEEGPVYVWADEFMMEEVFTNYLTNAIHYVKPQGKIRVWLEHKEGTVRVNVYNEGNCIDDKDIDKVFIKFYKADAARTREYGGSGIGLSIVEAAMKAHNKDYGVYNVEDGVVFYFELDTTDTKNA
jgi:signal transduction histidine kinase